MSDKREAVGFLVGGGLSVQRACALLHLHRSTFHYAAHPRDDTPLVVRIHSLAAQNPRYGYRRIDALLNQTERVNHKRVKPAILILDFARSHFGNPAPHLG